ncbi:MAG: decarboxylating 6-phosphogluconate dehydrogenase [Streptosporangiales bacterium]|nr:decarboxylating 6-phosphogluconate dehydrogenase [Streptosporangiales bacterium]
MQIAMVGLGRMGGNMAERLRQGGHDVIGYDRDPALSDASSLEDLVKRLTPPRVVWVMVPAGAATQATVDELGALLEAGDTVIDGGNSHYVDDRAHAEALAPSGVGFVDVGVSGGVWGLDNGYALMAGGSEEHVRPLMPAFETLKPPGAHGFVHAGGVGAGHFAKMVHNGIEYGMMQAFAEGYELLEASDAVTDVPGVFSSWSEGTVIRSWLLDLLNRALESDPGLAALRGYAEDSGEGRWTVQAGVDHAVPLPAITAALYARFASRQDDSPAMKVVAALRNQFGGHAIEAAKAKPSAADPPATD